jgi:hypothetical protein
VLSHVIEKELLQIWVVFRHHHSGYAGGKKTTKEVYSFESNPRLAAAQQQKSQRNARQKQPGAK